MKKALSLALAAALMTLSACAAPPPAQSMESTSAPAAQPVETEQDHIRALLEQCGVDIEITRFESSYEVNEFLECTVYSSLELPNVAALLVEKPDGSAFYITLPDNSSVDGMYVDDAGLLNVLTDGVIHGGDEVMHNGMGVFKVDLDAGEAVSYENNEFVYPQGVYGRECSTVDDHYTFGQCTVTEDAVTFRFDQVMADAVYTCGDPAEQKARFRAALEFRAKAGMHPYPEPVEFFDALDRGLPQSSGCAMGLDRLCMIFCDADDIADVRA